MMTDKELLTKYKALQAEYLRLVDQAADQRRALENIQYLTEYKHPMAYKQSVSFDLLDRIENIRQVALAGLR